MFYRLEREFRSRIKEGVMRGWRRRGSEQGMTVSSELFGLAAAIQVERLLFLPGFHLLPFHGGVQKYTERCPRNWGLWLNRPDPTTAPWST